MNLSIFCHHRVEIYAFLAPVLDVQKGVSKIKQGSNEYGSFHLIFKYIEYKEVWLGRET